MLLRKICICICLSVCLPTKSNCYSWGRDLKPTCVPVNLLCAYSEECCGGICLQRVYFRIIKIKQCTLVKQVKYLSPQTQINYYQMVQLARLRESNVTQQQQQQQQLTELNRSERPENDENIKPVVPTVLKERSNADDDTSLLSTSDNITLEEREHSTVETGV